MFRRTVIKLHALQITVKFRITLDLTVVFRHTVNYTHYKLL